MTIKQQMCGLAVALALLAGQAGAMSITFEDDSGGAKPNGWMSVESDLVSFTDSRGETLNLTNYGHQSDGQALAVDGDDQGYLIMDFTEDMGSLSLEFGNDDPGWIITGDEAILRAFFDGSQVAESRLVMNANDLMDQTIGLSGVRFDRATFLMDATLKNGLTEVVDNIQFERYTAGGNEAVVPEPMTMLAVSTSLVSLGGYIRRRRRTA